MARILPYLSYGTPTRMLILGRVVRGSGPRPPTANDPGWRNALNMLRRLRPRPVRHARVRVSLGGSVHEIIADDDGFLDAWIDLAAPTPASGRVPADLVLVTPPTGEEESDTRATTEIVVPAPATRFGVISDIDDTVIQSHVTSFLAAARTVLLSNARTRLPFPGVAAFYQALERGSAVAGAPSPHNPVFFVSSSPWNLHDLIHEFMVLQGIPDGPLLLRDWDLSRSLLRSSGHHAHKGPFVRQILDTYPELPFILLGDSGQEDPEIYRAVVHDYPRRILAVYIRNVSRSDARSAAIQRLIEEVRSVGSTLVLADDTLAAARHAASEGWIDPSALSAVEADMERDEGTAPGKVATP